MKQPNDLYDKIGEAGKTPTGFAALKESRRNCRFPGAAYIERTAEHVIQGKGTIKGRKRS